MTHTDMTETVVTTAGVGAILGLVGLLVVVLVVISVVDTARWTRRSALELKEIRKLLEERRVEGDDLPPWLGPQ